jgi:hypothetical protein
MMRDMNDSLRLDNRVKVKIKLNFPGHIIAYYDWERDFNGYDCMNCQEKNWEKLRDVITSEDVFILFEELSFYNDDGVVYEVMSELRIKPRFIVWYKKE